MILGIVGGMGPAATCDLFKKIIDFTPARMDQEHLHIIIDNNVNIPDRTGFILGNGESPVEEMRKSIERLELAGADYIAIPCNTAHYFYDEVAKYSRVKVLNMIAETANYLKKNFNQKEFLLLSTKGTYKAGVYRKVFKKFDLSVIEPKEEDQEIIMSWIYGVKSSKFDFNVLQVQELIDKYIGDRNIPIILGCTELPLLAEKIGVPKEFINPTVILAKRCVEIGKG